MIALSILTELLSDNCWTRTYFIMLPLELLVKIFHIKWQLEYDEHKINLRRYFKLRSLGKNRMYHLRTATVFNCTWTTDNGNSVIYNIKYGPNYIYRNVHFTKEIELY